MRALLSLLISKHCRQKAAANVLALKQMAPVAAAITILALINQAAAAAHWNNHRKYKFNTGVKGCYAPSPCNFNKL
jgi:hypothetical protein